MGAQFAKQGLFDSSLFYLNKAIELKNDYKPAYLNRGVTYMNLDSNEKAIKDFEKYLDFGPDADVFNSIGVCYQKMRKYQESVLSFSRAIETGTNPVFYLNRSYSYSALQYIDKAREDALSAKKNGIILNTVYAASLGIQ